MLKNLKTKPETNSPLQALLFHIFFPLLFALFALNSLASLIQRRFLPSGLHLYLAWSEKGIYWKFSLQSQRGLTLTPKPSQKQLGETGNVT